MGSGNSTLSKIGRERHRTSNTKRGGESPIFEPRSTTLLMNAIGLDPIDPSCTEWLQSPSFDSPWNFS